MDLVAIRKYLGEHYPGQHIRLVSQKYVTKYWRWDSQERVHVLLYPHQMVGPDELKDTLRLLRERSEDWRELDPLVEQEVADLAIIKFARGLSYTSVQLEDIPSN